MRMFLLLLFCNTIQLHYAMEGPYTPLHTAALYGHLDRVKEYINQGTPVDVQNGVGHTPLHFAVLGDQPDVVTLLIENEAQLETKDMWEDTPLSLATRKRKWGVAFTLLQAGASITVSKQSDPETFKKLITTTRTMSTQERVTAKTLLLIYNRKDSILAKLPKDLFFTYFLPLCCLNINYARGNAQKRVSWHLSELKRMLKVIDKQECEQSGDQGLVELLDPENVEQYRQLIEKGYGVTRPQ